MQPPKRHFPTTPRQPTMRNNSTTVIATWLTTEARRRMRDAKMDANLAKIDAGINELPEELLGERPSSPTYSPSSPEAWLKSPVYTVDSEDEPESYTVDSEDEPQSYNVDSEDEATVPIKRESVDAAVSQPSAKKLKMV